MDKLNMENSCDTKQKIMDGGANDANEIISRAKFKILRSKIQIPQILGRCLQFTQKEKRTSFQVAKQTLG